MPHREGLYIKANATPRWSLAYFRKQLSIKGVRVTGDVTGSDLEVIVQAGSGVKGWPLQLIPILVHLVFYSPLSRCAPTTHVKNMLKGQIRRAWLQLVRCAPYLKRKQWRTTKGRGGGDKSIGINPKMSGGRREDNSSRTEEGMSRV
ncbi:hypothetical protein C8R48DRAFT_679587 [Suillus tomentosus]|nr:hypothetical protein C8R48DRAFT_679587 [Suillus tomentosus]